MDSPFARSGTTAVHPPIARAARLLAVLIAISPALPAAGQAQQAAPATDSVPQVDVLDLIGRVFGKKGKQEAGLPDTLKNAPPPEGRIMTILPSFSVNPATGVQLGVSGNVVRRFGPRESTNLSYLNAGVSYTTKGQFNVTWRSNVFLSGNRLKFEGDWRYLDTKQPTYGLGAAHPESDRDDMDFRLFRFYQTIYWRVYRRLLIGPGYLLDYHFNIRDHNADAGLPSPVVDYHGGYPTSTTSSGVSFNALIDTRDSPIYATRGLLAYASARSFPSWLGSDDTWRELQLEVRFYQRLDAATRHVIAFWGFGRVDDGLTPYLDLPAIGWDTNNRTGRGYPQGRIRGTKGLYGEAEYRVVLTRNGLLGAAAFVNATSAADATTRRLQPADFGGGGGLRIKLNKRSRSNITIDYGVGAQGSKGLFLSGSEAF
jgi:outer membrane protein assembly factor BamA